MDNLYDYIIVGANLSGLLIAKNLSKIFEDKSILILDEKDTLPDEEIYLYSNTTNKEDPYLNRAKKKLKIRSSNTGSPLLKLISKSLDNYAYTEVCTLNFDINRIKNVTIKLNTYVSSLIFDVSKDIIIVKTNKKDYLVKGEVILCAGTINNFNIITNSNIITDCSIYEIPIKELTIKYKLQKDEFLNNRELFTTIDSVPVTFGSDDIGNLSISFEVNDNSMCEQLTSAVNKIRKLSRSQGLKNWIDKEVLAECINPKYYSMNNIIDNNYKLKNVEGVRICDISTVDNYLRINKNEIEMMLAEKCTEAIIGDIKCKL